MKRIGATGSSNDSLASFSSRGPIPGISAIKPDVSAPGVSVRSSVRNSGYGSMSGTSMATPHVAGVVALMLSAKPSLKGNPAQIRARILQSADDLGEPGADAFYGKGRINIARALGVID